LILCGKYFLDEIQDTWFTKWTREKYFLYNWKTKEIFQNELTKFLTGIETGTRLSNDENIDLKGRYMFADFPIPGKVLEFKKVKITWDENYENIKVLNLLLNILYTECVLPAKNV